MTEEISRFYAKVQGRVQGVFFRASTRERARELGLTGWVRNLPDGAVEIEAQGPKQRLEQMLAWCRQGPPGARVDRLDFEWIVKRDGERDFGVRY